MKFVFGTFFPLVFCVFAVNSVYGQSRPARFGTVSMSDLKATPDFNDTTAEAIILFDKGHFNGNEVTFTRHLRIKVLKSSGTHWGNWVINAPSKSSIKAIVFNLENGRLVESRLENTSIFKEQFIDDFYVYKIFVPNVKIGSVIDIKYNHLGFPFEWRFQERIPVTYSELVLEESPYLAYSKTQYGFEPIRQVSPTKWVATNVPAFKTEPFLSDYSNYITKFELQVTSIQFSAPEIFLNFQFSSSWRVVSDFLLNHPRFRDVLVHNAFLNEAAKEIVAKESSVEGRIWLAYDYIRSNIKWNGHSSVFASTYSNAQFKKDHSGNSADINLCLVALLNKVGVEARPVVLSTRDHGFISPAHASLNKLNYVIAQVEEGDTQILLDATSDKLIPGILPDRCLNGWGLVLEPENERWTTLETKYTKRKKQHITITIDKNGGARATVLQHFDQYGYLEWIQSHETAADEQKYLHDLNQEFPNLQINNYKVERQDRKALSADETFEIDLSDHLIDLDREVLFSPFVLSDCQKNPFKDEKRRYPVDLAYPSEFLTTIAINLPENLRVKAIPEPVMFTTTDRSAVFKVLSGVHGSQIQFQLTFKINKVVFGEEEYTELREFYTQMIKKVNESVHLARN